MNNRNRNSNYRRSIYRKRKIRNIIILSVGAVLLAFVIFMIIGTVLQNKTKTPDYDDDFETSKPTDKNTLAAAQTVGAYALPLLQDGSDFSARLAAISNEANAVCINLNSEDGTLLFRSGMSQSLPTVGVHQYASDLSSAMSSIDGNGFYTSGILYVTAFDASSDLLVDVELSVAGALACEAIREGVGDVLFIPPSLDPDNVDKMCSLADRIHLTQESSVIGLVLSEEILTADNRVSLIDKLSKHFNYLCLDTTAYADADPLEYIEDKVSDMQLDLMYYKMRVLLPYSSDGATQEKYIQTVKKYNIASWQVKP